MDDTNSLKEQNTEPQLAEENSISGNGSSSPTPEKGSLEKHLEEQTVDLNELFPDSETDLNNLFPDTEVKHLLKKIIKNKKDMNLIKERLVTENEKPEEG